ncbi:MAG: MFS transporter [Deltaproteobacteria bacterium]|nr:MFS transporter [Deltaproteobacteria bacterium]
MLYTPQFFTISLAGFLTACNAGAFFLFPLFIADRGGTTVDIGYIMSASFLASVLSRPLISEIIDRLGRKRSYFLANLTMIGTTLSCIGFTGALRDFFWPLLLIRMIHGISGGFTFTAGFTYVMDIIPGKRMNEGVGIFGAFSLIGFAVGPVMAEFFIDQWGFSAYFLAAAGLPAIGAFLLLFLPESHVVGRGSGAGSYMALLKRPKIFTVTVLMFILGMGLASTSGFISLFAQSRGIALVSTYFIAYSASATALRLVGGKFIDRVGEDRVAPYALIVGGFGLIFLLFMNSMVYLLVAGLISGSSQGMLYPSLNTMAVRNEPTNLRARIMATITGALDLGSFAGSIILGQIGKALGFPAIFATAGVGFFVGFIMIKIYSMRYQDIQTRG